jgi:hypothetical protein
VGGWAGEWVGGWVGGCHLDPDRAVGGSEVDGSNHVIHRLPQLDVRILLPKVFTAYLKEETNALHVHSACECVSVIDRV